ncbi:TfuA-like protein [uncultured Ruegeria sp.]|uniref:TfuA-like protein n=1 Tax=uncultured Ruegeria sp. TaxID=259304 RepID=UPI0026219A00|nr:TfuA-like protein [uncultured Ruegeria sp.]
MSIIVFVGPTLRAESVQEHLDATILPPVQQGDVYRVVRDKPRVIGIIDGFFDGVPSVWHKEILWALEQGIPVFGSASMGALRAAELADFGMIGVGRVFEEYLSGAIADDDEVAVLHGPAELGFMPLSEPMVSIRATLAEAKAAKVVSEEVAQTLLDAAKSLHYRDRVWDKVIAAADTTLGLEVFRSWLPEGQVDAKGDDAREMLTQMAQHLKAENESPVAPRVERTLVWRELQARVDSESASQETEARALVDEVRLDPELYTRLRDRAALHLLARDEAHRIDHLPDRDALRQQMTAHRFVARLPRHADLMEWLQDNDLTLAQYEAMLADRAHKDAVISARADDLDTALLAELRHDGSYGTLRDRARRKADHLEALHQVNGAAGDTNRTQSLIWFFETRLDQAIPDDLESYAIALGLEGREAFLDLIEAEFMFCHVGGDPEDQVPDKRAEL